jgi:hypothetical protein
MGDTPYLENAYGTLPAYGFTIADHKLFVTNDEHSPDSILWRGGRLWTLDAETGELLWSISGRHRQATVSDGILTAYNLYDNQLYTFGKGPSKTTVTAPDTNVPLGTGITIKGSVTDQTPASKDTPAISDESMAAWMEYLHMQKPKPANATGVTVKLTAYDPNGNSQAIGSTTTDTNGKFALVWTPTLEGTYYVIATFEGSNSYYSSEDTTYFAVGSAAASPAPTATPTPTAAPTVTPVPTASPSPAPQPEAGPSTDMYIIAAAAAVIIVVVAVAALVLRKRK